MGSPSVIDPGLSLGQGYGGGGGPNSENGVPGGSGGGHGMNAW